MQRFATLVTLAVFVLVHHGAHAEETDLARLVRELKPLWSCVSGSREAYSIAAQVEIAVDGGKQPIEARFSRYDGQSFDLDLKHPEYWVQIRRRADMTAFALPYHKVAFVGKGEVDASDCLAPAEASRRLIGQGSQLTTYVPLTLQDDPSTVAFVLTGLLQARFDPQTKTWNVGKDASFQLAKDGNQLMLTIGSTKATLEISEQPAAPAAAGEWPGLKIVELPRKEIERSLARGLRRACEIAAPGPLLTAPVKKDRKVEHGELRWIAGERVVLLGGSPEQIGQAHGQLLPAEANRCIDSVLYAFGTVQTIRTGRWFRQDLEAAYARLSPHIPQDHKLENRALASALGHDPQLIEALNVFPELFHCSGFALFGKATEGGKLYHGRVLDYMTMIGLQDAATTFIVAVDGKIPFANVGYAGFIGSVSGMNAQAISLGEMGGGGEGQWDGAPMATLMRRALEECSTLDEVMGLWKNSPRTCEYYYVFADGKTNRAVGVAATPEKIQFVQPGESHERLGKGIEDAVILSAGKRLETLRQRVIENYGHIEEDLAISLMSRPVAMESNLHNVLFVPADGVFYVANADHKHPAADRPYTQFNLKKLLDSMKSADSQPAAAKP